jgi:DNA polymerase-3 subunit delta
LALFGKAGLGQKALTVGPDGRVARETKDALFLELSVPSEPGAEAFIDAAARYAAERDLKVAKGDDALALDAAISRGFPPGHVLIVAAGKVDGRLPLVKKLAAAGRRVTTALAKEGPRDSDRLLLSPLLESLLAGTGKRVDRAGEVALGERVGEDARVLASEVEKLRAYVGDRKVIGKADVLAVVARVAPDPFFALGNAVEGRDLREALSVLDRSIADGVSPFLLLASLAGTVRRLLVEQERGRQVAEGRRIGSYEEWSTLALPTIRKEELGSRKPYGIWKKYQASLRFTRDELMDALCGLARADLGMKSGQDERMGLEQVLFGLLAKERVERSGP